MWARAVSPRLFGAVFSEYQHVQPEMDPHHRQRVNEHRVWDASVVLRDAPDDLHGGQDEVGHRRVVLLCAFAQALELLPCEPDLDTSCLIRVCFPYLLIYI